MITTIRKRDGRDVSFDVSKIALAIEKAMKATGRTDTNAALALAQKVEAQLSDYASVEDIQDQVERVLMENGYALTAKRYILYRAERTRVREMNTRLMKVFEDITYSDAQDSDIKRENANIDGNTAMGMMLKYGSEGAKEFYEKFVLKPEHAAAHRDGDIHIHDMDFLTLTTTCCQIDLHRLFQGGFSTGHGHLREPNDIQSYAALACIAIQSNQNDQHGGQSVVNFDYGMGPGVVKTYRRLYRQNVAKVLEILTSEDAAAHVKEVFDALAAENLYLVMTEQSAAVDEDMQRYLDAEAQRLTAWYDADVILQAQTFARKKTFEETERATFQAMEAFIHNLNTMHSRAGAQTPFSSINYGMDTSPEGRMVVRNILKATVSGLGHGETAIFPIQIFRVKDGINYNPGEPNYDLFQQACSVSAQRLFPNFSFQDAPFNLQYYKGTPETEIAYMGCRTRVIGNTYDPSQEISPGRGNLSFTSVNLPRLAIRSHQNMEWFFEELERKLELTVEQLLERFEIQAHKRVRNFPFLMGQGVWLDSEKLDWNDEIREVLKHGTLTVGFIGLAEALSSLTGHHHGASPEARNLGLEIVGFMREYLDRKSEEYKLNFSLIATPAEGLSDRFLRIDRRKYGVIPGVTDHDFYTNSFHVPVYYDISAFDKIQIEAPYHALTNAGHITYVELDGNVAHNPQAYEQVLRCMHDAGVGYGSINHPLDRDIACGYSGIIGDTCPNCGRHEEEGTAFERIRRVTGYLGTLDRFNNGKKAEEKERVKHGMDVAQGAGMTQQTDSQIAQAVSEKDMPKETEIIPIPLSKDAQEAVEMMSDVLQPDILQSDMRQSDMRQSEEQAEAGT